MTTISQKAAKVRPLKPQLPDEPGHTPGPWRWNKNDTCIWPTSGRRAPVADVFTATDPATELSEPSDSFSAEETANARLIAAAPDLLEALKAIRLAFLSPGYAKNATDLQLADQARAAIAKATGQP